MQSIVVNAKEIKQKIHESALLPVRQLLPDQRIEDWWRGSGLPWRKRFFTPAVSLLMCIWKHMDKSSARAIEDRLASMVPTWNHAHRDGRDFLNARARIPIRVLQHGARHVSECAQAACARFWQGLRVALVDGTTTTMPRTEKNVAAFGTSSNQHGSSHFPLLRILLISCAGSFFDVAFGPYTAAEARLWIILLLRLPSNMLVIGDTTFCSYMALCLAQRRGSHLIAPLSSARRQDTCIKVLEKNDELHRWTRPRAAHVLYPRLLESVPETIQVRIIHATVQRKGYRDYSLTLCTTLLDPRLHPAEAIVELYLQRWNIEVDIRTLKAVHGLEHLTAKSPQIIIREMYSAILAFNCTRALMAQSGAPLYSLSHQRCTTRLLDMACQMSQASTPMLPSLFRHLLRLMAEAKLDQYDRPPEPRAIVRNRRRFPYMTKISRSEWRSKNAIPA
jgi:hypothetical protein